MKVLNLGYFRQITLGEMSDFLKWLDHAPEHQSTIRRLKSNPPLRGSKISPALKILEQFEFVKTSESHISLTPSGLQFAQSNLVAKMQALRTLFLAHEQVQAIQEQLKGAAKGRLKTRVLYYTMKEGLETLTEEDFRGFIDWAHWSELLHYDKKRDEVSLSSDHFPQSPTQGVADVRAVS